MTSDSTGLLQSISPYLEQWVAYQTQYRGVTGVQVAVRYQGRSILNFACGKANVVTDEHLTSEHLFRIASHSKPMTAVIVMRLIEDEDLRLDDLVGELVTELSDTAVGGVNVRELLGHQAGIVRDSSEGDFWQLRWPFLSRDELLKVLYEEGAVFSPNEHFKYTNIGYGLLGLIAERVRNQSYAELAEEFILEPLALCRTGPEYDQSRAQEYAAGHTARVHYGEERQLIGHVSTGALGPATGWFSTADELARYAGAHVFGDDTLLSDASKRLMQRKESEIELPDGSFRHYGLGLELNSIGDRQLVGHSGGYPGHITRTWVDPQEGLAVSALTNDYDGPADAIVTGIIQLINLAEAAAEEDPPEIPQNLYITGRFENLSGVTDLVDLGGVLHVIMPRMSEPTLAHQRLSLQNGHLVHEAGAGFATPGEPVRIHWADGIARSVHLGAKTVWPPHIFREAMSSLDPGAPLKTLPL